MDTPVGSGIANSPHLVAFVEAMKDSILRVDPGLVLVQSPDFAPPEALIFLAQQLNVLGYRGYTLAITDQQKRALLNSARYLNRIAATPFALKRAILATGYFKSVIVREHTGVNYNGSFNYDGSKKYGGGRWYNFSVEVFYTGVVPSASRQALVEKLILEWKNVRSVLLDLKFTVTT